MLHLLDFQLLPVPRFSRAFMRLDDDVAAGIAPLKRLSERARNAVRFALWSAGTSETLRCPASEVRYLREGCFRAALTEFVSMEEVQSLDYKDQGLSKTPLKLNDTSDPILHLFREIRNLEVHLQQSELRSVQRDFMWGDIDRPTEATDISMLIWSLEGVTPQSFGSLRNAKNYTADQIAKMTSWLNTTQKEWGIQELFVLAVENYCRLLKT